MILDSAKLIVKSEHLVGRGVTLTAKTKHLVGRGVTLAAKTKHLVGGNVSGSTTPRHQEGVNATDTDVMGVKAGTTGLRTGEHTEEAGWMRTPGQLLECRVPTPPR